MSTVGCHHLCTWTSQLGPFGLGPSGLGPSGLGPSRLGPSGLSPSRLGTFVAPKDISSCPKGRHKLLVQAYKILSKSSPSLPPPSIKPLTTQYLERGANAIHAQKRVVPL